MARNLGVAGIQMKIAYGKDHMALMEGKLRTVQSLFPWVDLVFFSELVSCGLADENAVTLDSSTVHTFTQWARTYKKWLIPGSFYEKLSDRTYNTSLVISPDGEIVARYRKMFPWKPLEIAGPEDNGFCVFDIPGKGRFGLCICYDQWFPEVGRTLAWMGAEAVFCPTATPTPDRPQEMVMARANAIANQLYWFSLNGLGDGGIGQSIFIDPEGQVLQSSGETERIMTQIIDLDLVSRVRQYGTLGQCQLWKSFRDFSGRFPVYSDRERAGEIYRDLGPLQQHLRIDE
jgi:predicted amidohydrolase